MGGIQRFFQLSFSTAVLSLFTQRGVDMRVKLQLNRKTSPVKSAVLSNTNTRRINLHNVSTMQKNVQTKQKSPLLVKMVSLFKKAGVISIKVETVPMSSVVDQVNRSHLQHYLVGAGPMQQM